METSWPADELVGLVGKLGLGAASQSAVILPESPTTGLPSANSSSTELLGSDRPRTNSLPRSPTGSSLSVAPSQGTTVSSGGSANLGWGGQAIPDTAHFKAPWFGKNRSRGGSNARGRGAGRGRGQNGNASGRRGVRRAWGNDSPDGDDSASSISVDSMVRMVRSTPASEPISQGVYQALFQLDSRASALLLKELAKSGLLFRAVELFDWLRGLEAGHPLQALLDVYSYTAMISLCIAEQDAERALQLAAEMKSKNIERNVHTYTALMNVLIKCGKHGLALDTYKLMRQDGCIPNVVTFNTLIDVYGKMGKWEDAVGVLDSMKHEGIQPVLRTYNTLIIACNMCNQPREAVAVYKRMLDEGYSPNSTTYNALISAYGKDCQLQKVMEVFQEMTCRGCERSVITYSSLISACEKAGQWELALEFFQEMCRERCTPNTVTYNSLITALAQGSQWEKAQEVFEQMRGSGCRPDVVTYTAFISALEKGGQWKLALDAFERMRAQGCRADGIVYNAIIDTLWETGVVWAQRRSLMLFRMALEEGHFVQGKIVPGGLTRCEVNLHAMTAGVAMLSLYTWLLQLKQLCLKHGVCAMPPTLAIVTDKGKGSREQGNLVVKEAIQAVMANWEAPFKAVLEGGYSGVLESGGMQVAEWLLSNAFEQRLSSFFPCTDIVPPEAPGQAAQTLGPAMAAELDDPNCVKERAVERRCTEAFAAVRHFEKTHCLALQNMGYAYLQRRSRLVARCLELAKRLGVQEESAQDGVLLMDRVMSTALSLHPDLLDLLVTACLTTAIRQADGPARMRQLPPQEELEAVTQLPYYIIEQMEWSIQQVLGGDAAAISALRCLKLYLERLGAGYMQPTVVAAMAGKTFGRIRDSLTDMAFLNCRPSVIAAALLYVERRAQGMIPFWPTMLAKLTGYQDMSTPELAVAIKAAQRMASRTGRASAVPASAAPSSTFALARPPNGQHSRSPSLPIALAAALSQHPAAVPTPPSTSPLLHFASNSGGSGSSGSGSPSPSPAAFSAVSVTSPSALPPLALVSAPVGTAGLGLPGVANGYAALPSLAAPAAVEHHMHALQTALAGSPMGMSTLGAGCEGLAPVAAHPPHTHHPAHGHALGSLDAAGLLGLQSGGAGSILTPPYSHPSLGGGAGLQGVFHHQQLPHPALLHSQALSAGGVFQGLPGSAGMLLGGGGGGHAVVPAEQLGHLLSQQHLQQGGYY